jgi:hypothetical protein
MTHKREVDRTKEARRRAVFRQVCQHLKREDHKIIRGPQPNFTVSPRSSRSSSNFKNILELEQRTKRNQEFTQ